MLYVPLYLAFIRTTFYLAVVFGYAAIDLLATATAGVSGSAAGAEPVGRSHASATYLRNAGAVIILALTGMVAVREARIAEKGSWIGFGISAINPVVEAEFLAASKLGPNLYNFFDSGGYLLWRLDPTYEVMIDSRFFPYKAWFDELYAFSTGQNFEAFLKKYPADTAVIDLDRAPLWKNFLQSKEWRLAFFGPTSAVFVDRAVSDNRLAQNFAPDRFDRLRNGRNALGVFDFALVIGDYATAWKALDQAERLSYQIDEDSLQSALGVREGYRHLARAEYDGALAGFVAARSRAVQGWREPVIAKLLEDRSAAKVRNDTTAVERNEAALRELTIPMPP